MMMAVLHLFIDFSMKIYIIFVAIIDPINDIFMLNLSNSNIQKHASNILLSCYEDSNIKINVL